MTWIAFSTGQAKTGEEFEPLPAFVVLVIAMHSSY
jgi:hypothetical protein